MFTSWFEQKAMETIRAKPVVDVVSKVLSQATCNTFSLKNASIRTSYSRFQERLAAQQESSAVLAEQEDQLKRKADNTDSEFEEFKKQQQKEYNELREHIMLLSAGNSQSC
jgi:predicted RNase H-like nuclease (RuvC/YqgF family)